MDREPAEEEEAGHAVSGAVLDTYYVYSQEGNPCYVLQERRPDAAQTEAVLEERVRDISGDGENECTREPDLRAGLAHVQGIASKSRTSKLCS